MSRLTPEREKEIRILVEVGAFGTALAADLLPEIDALRLTLKIVIGSTIMAHDDHDWTTCKQPSCVAARVALAKDEKEWK